MGAEPHAQSPTTAPERAHRERSAELAPVTAVDSPAPLTPHPTRPLTPAALLRLQRSHGNAFVGHRLGKPGELQRHPEGFEPSADPAKAAEEINSPPPLEGQGEAAAPATDGAPAGDAESAPAEEAAPPTPESSEPAPPAEGTAPTGGPATAPATPKAMDLAKAKEVLTKSYGSTKTIVPGNIVLLADRAATWKKYDEVTKGRKNPHTNAPWVDGDAQKYIPGLDGFADKGTVYVNQTTTLATATAHEMLHNNTAAGFRAAVGETINEGSTEYLALKALKESSIPLSTGVAYPNEVAFVTKLIGLVTEATLISAYFGGANTLIDAFDKKQGTGKFASMKTYAEAKNYTEAGKIIDAPSAAAKSAVF
jgi:hypothetical protein